MGKRPFTTCDLSRFILNFFKVFSILGLSLVLVTGCQKKSGSTAATGGGGTTTNDGEIEYEVSATIAEDEAPLDFVESIGSVEIGGVNLSSSTAKFNISAFYLSPLGKKILVYQGTFNGNSFSFKSKVPKHLIVVEALRVRDGGKFAGLLPPPMRSLLAKLRITRTSSIAAKMAGIIADKAASGNAVARSALETNSLSVADVLTAAQSVRRTVDEQQSKGSGSAIDLSALAIKLAEKSNERLSALVAEGQSTEGVAAKISQKTYESVFGENAETTPPGVLAHRTNLNLGTSTAATKDVAYEAIKTLGTDSTKIVEEAFRVEATTYREASSVTAAVAAELTVANQFSDKFDRCIANILDCAAVAYTPPQPSSGGNSGGTTLPVITINTQPSNQTAVNGGATFSVTASVTNSATLSYQWQKQESGEGSFANVSGATGSTLSLSSLTNAADNTDVYKVLVSATGGATNVTSSSATLSVEPCAANGWCAGESKYYLGGQVTTLDSGGNGTWNSQTYTAGFLKSIITITSQPSNQTAVNGSASFSVSASFTNGATPSYQWQKQESGSGSFSVVSVTTSSTLTLSGLTNASDNGDVYRVVVSASGGAESVTSSSATLSVEPCAANGWCAGESKYYLGGQVTTLDSGGNGTWNSQTYTAGFLKSIITITSQPSNQTAVNGSASFSVSASFTNGATPSYQWQKQESGSGSFSVVSVTTSSTLTLSGLTNASDNGDVYRVVVSASGGAESVTSSSGSLTVTLTNAATVNINYATNQTVITPLSGGPTTSSAANSMSALATLVGSNTISTLTISGNDTFTWDVNLAAGINNVILNSGANLTGPAYSSGDGLAATLGNGHLVLSIPGNFTVNSGASVNMDAKGYVQNRSYHGISIGGAGKNVDCVGGGGSYGTSGGGGAIAGSVFGASDFWVNLYLGSGGGDSFGFHEDCYPSSPGGNGGGAIYIAAANITNAGTISARGESSHAGGGSGGTIYLVSSGSLSNTGTITTAGGSALGAGRSNNGGFGRVKLGYDSQGIMGGTIIGVTAAEDTTIASVSVNVAGGGVISGSASAYSIAGSWTAYGLNFSNISSAVGVLTIPTLTFSGTGVFVLDATPTMSIQSLTLNNGVVLTAQAYSSGDGRAATLGNGHLVLSIPGNFTVNSGASVNMDAKGYVQNRSYHGISIGGAGKNVDCVGGGGSYGTSGGGGAIAGSVFGASDFWVNLYLGSGGGDSFGFHEDCYPSSPGGNGGGAIYIAAANITNAGTISARGESSHAGGGSGGTIYLVSSGSLSNTGTITTAGGSALGAGRSNNGGFGRVKFVYATGSSGIVIGEQ